MQPRAKALTASVLFVFIALLGALLWYGGRRLSDLNQQLIASESRIRQIDERLTEYSREVDHALEQAKEARQQAGEAERKEQQAQSARAEAEQQAEAARTAQQTAEVEKARANAESAEAREELAQIQKRREEELDRMQMALDRIAPTKRTPSGIVMTLSEKAFRFDFDKAELRTENRETLSRVAGVLLASEGYRLFVDGHTDDVGTDQYNEGLSERRATAVRDYLVKAGIPSGLITIHGFGKQQPLMSEKTPDARAQNRRVEIGIVDTIIRYNEGARN
jgi:outer membrane protein OmpA-like peptidoglycan-associated protein